MAETIQKRRLLAPCASYDVERIESWLQDMAKDGWVLDGDSAYWLGFFTFVKAEPQEVRYRLDPKPRKHTDFTNAPDEDAEALFRDYGWEFVTAYTEFYIYRTADPQARELNTDLQVQAAALKYVRRNALSSMALEAYLLIDWFLRLRFEAVRFLVSLDWIILFAFVIMLVTALCYTSRRFFHIHKLRRQLRENIPLDHNKPWRKNASAKRAIQAAMVALDVFVIVALFTSCFNTMSRNFEHTPVAEFPGDPPFITCADLGEFTKENFLSDYNAYNQYSTTLAPNIIEWKEYGSIITEDGRTLHGSLWIDYYETRSPRLARGLVDNFLHQHKKYDNFKIVTSPDIQVDHVISYHYIYPVVLIQHDNIFIRAIVSLEYKNQNALEEWAQKMAEILINTP